MRLLSGCNHPSFTFPWRTLLAHLMALHLLHLGSAQLRVVAPSLRVAAIVGQDVVLRCHLSPCKDAWSSDIRWIQHRSSGLVHHYQNGVDLEQMEEYKERTELLRNGLSDGNLDLRITAVRSSDSGSYSCAVQDGDNHGEAVVNLEVSDPFSEIVHPWKVALAVVITLLLGSFAVVIVFLHRKRAAQRRELEAKDAVLDEVPAILGLNAANLKILASKLMKQMEKLDIRNSLLKKQYEKTEILAEEVEKHCDEMDLRGADLKNHIEELVEQRESVEEWNSLLKKQYEKLGLRATNLRKQVEKLENKIEVVEKHFKKIGISIPNLKLHMAELEEQAEAVENRKSELKRHLTNMGLRAAELMTRGEALVKRSEAVGQTA
uniref:BG-like antigen 5 n=2 Tax=Meleagris gallopavo TaxID=9103 RepID=E7D213_MELGA|nr:BG-like antigen 5 [Meleagris gallopavo]